MNTSKIQIFTTKEGITEIEVKLDKASVWLKINQMIELFERDKSVISRHINSIFKKGELNRKATVAKYAQVQKEGKRKIERSIK